MGLSYSHNDPVLQRDAMWVIIALQLICILPQLVQSTLHRALTEPNIANIHDICASSEWKQAHTRVLVTGAAGFIGFHVAKTWTERPGVVVLGIDNYDSYYSVLLKRTRQSILRESNVTILYGDINAQHLMYSICTLCDFTVIVHLAAQAGVRHALKEPMAYVHSNLAGTVALLEVIRSLPTKPRLVYASSSSVYGLSHATPFEEGDRADNPISLYAASKRAMEHIVFSYHHNYAISTTGLRFFTVYGPWGRPDMACMLFADRISHNAPVVVFRAPDSQEIVRDFTYIDDIVQGIIASAETSPESTPGIAKFRIYNLGGTHPVPLTEMVQFLATYLNKTARIIYKPITSSSELLRTHANFSQAQRDLQYQPNIPLRDGLKHFVNWYVKWQSSSAL